jgi:hypothetical protein
MGVLLQNVERGQSGVWHVTHVLFAYDLAVVDTSQERLQSQMHSLLRYANDKGLTVNVSKCAVLVTGMRGMGGTYNMAMTTYPMLGSSVTWACGRTRLWVCRSLPSACVCWLLGGKFCQLPLSMGCVTCRMP